MYATYVDRDHCSVSRNIDRSSDTENKIHTSRTRRRSDCRVEAQTRGLGVLIII